MTVTSLVYQPLFPSVPLTFGVTTGGVESVTGGGSTWSVKLAGAVFQVLPDLPPVTVATLIVYVPGTPDVNDTALAFAGPHPTRLKLDGVAVTFAGTDSVTVDGTDPVELQPLPPSSAGSVFDEMS